MFGLDVSIDDGVDWWAAQVRWRYPDSLVRSAQRSVMAGIRYEAGLVPPLEG